MGGIESRWTKRILDMSLDEWAALCLPHRWNQRINGGGGGGAGEMGEEGEEEDEEGALH